MFTLPKNFYKFFIKYLLVMFFSIGMITATGADNKRLSQRKDIQVFIIEMTNKHKFNKAELEALFDQVVIQQEVLTSISSPMERKPWHVYRQVFFNKDRSIEGVEFWKRHEAAFKRAEQEYGIPPSIIISILGVETLYGKFQGKYRVIDSLTTLAFNYPPRADFFRKELEEYLLLTRENNIPATRFKGSYAGAIGQPQFMPSSYRYYAVAYDGKGIKDLQHNSDDVIVSVANYLKKHGWQANEPVVLPAKVTGNQYQHLDSKNMKPRFDHQELVKHGITPAQKLAKEDKAFLITLEAENSLEFWVGLQNFYAITRYNPSVNYAMAVYQLSQQIDDLKKQS